jgi:hypothetical protein
MCSCLTRAPQYITIWNPDVKVPTMPLIGAVPLARKMMGLSLSSRRKRCLAAPSRMSRLHLVEDNRKSAPGHIGNGADVHRPGRIGPGVGGRFPSRMIFWGSTGQKP